MKILDIVDMQNGFMNKDGSLYVNKSDEIIPKANEFLSKATNFDFALIKFDTHFNGEYEQSNEATQFPPHCIYDTYDWNLAINENLIKIPKFYMLKNCFDMWADSIENNPVINENDKDAYNSLFKISDKFKNFNNATQRNEFFKSKIDEFDKLEVFMIGVASDYCNRYAFEGYLKLGASVTIIKDLTKGILIETDDIINETLYKEYVKNGKLKSINSYEITK